MNRRLAIKQVLILAGGVVLLPSCLRTEDKSTLKLSHLDVSLSQEQLLAEITELIIPKTDTPGAKDLNLHLFVLKMVDDCMDTKDHEHFMKGFTYFEGRKPEEIKTLIAEANAGKKALPEEVINFYKVVKSRTIGGYLNSKYVMSNLVIWELVPGRYNGYFPVKAA